MHLPFTEPQLLQDGMWLLPGFAHRFKPGEQLAAICAKSPPRQMVTPWGKPMSVFSTSVGNTGWISDQQGYRYSNVDPNSGQRWPDMPASFVDLASSATAAIGVDQYQPDTCLIHRYDVGAQMGAHQDDDEHDMTQPIVSVSLGLDATFFFRPSSSGSTTPVPLHDGDVLVFGGPLRRCYHGIRKIQPGTHPIYGPARWNLTFRRATPMPADVN